MPHRPYTSVELALQAHDFIGTAHIWGRGDVGPQVSLGEFTIFDLSGQHLSRSTSFPLQESTFPELHIELQLRPAPGTGPQPFPAGIVTGASVPPSRSAQTLYTTVAATTNWKQHGFESVATLDLPAHVPVARVVIAVDPAYNANFLRDVTVIARPTNPEPGERASFDAETVNGHISQINFAASTTDPAIDDRQMAIESILAANLHGAATVRIAVINGNDSPLPLQSVELQMRQRAICFDIAPGTSTYTLMYGDSKLSAPLYDYSHSSLPAPLRYRQHSAPNNPTCSSSPARTPGPSPSAIHNGFGFSSSPPSRHSAESPCAACATSARTRISEALHCSHLARRSHLRLCQRPGSGSPAPAPATNNTELFAAHQAMSAKRYTEAERHFRAALASNSNGVAARMGLADAELALHQYEAAELDYRRVVADQPQMWVAHKNLVIVEAALGRWDEFDRERALLRAARQRGADGISTHESDVIDSFDGARQHWIVREYFEPVGRSQARYNFESFAPDGRVREYISLELGEAARAAPAQDSTVAIGEAGPPKPNHDHYALNWYTARAHGTVHVYPEGEPTYERVRRDVQHWLHIASNRE